MAKENKKWRYILGFFIFTLYMFIAAHPIPRETVVKPRWITSVESNYPISLGENTGYGEELLPFSLGNRYGYLGDNGTFAINQVRTGYVSLSENRWAEYEAVPYFVEVMDPRNEMILRVEKTRGYPLFLDDRIFMTGSEQNSITSVGKDGEILWTHDFPAPLTCVDAAGGFVLAGTLDGTVELLDSSGNPVFTPFEPGGSRLSVILGCAISRDGARLAVISGVDEQRFLLLERSGEGYKVIHHEFLNTGFRRPVHISFVDGGTKVAYEREGGLGIYDISARSVMNIGLEGEIVTLDNSGGNRFLFVITSQGSREKRFIALRYPGTIVIEAPFKSSTAFFARRDSKLYIGGDMAMASFELERQ